MKIDFDCERFRMNELQNALFSLVLCTCGEQWLRDRRFSIDEIKMNGKLKTALEFAISLCADATGGEDAFVWLVRSYLCADVFVADFHLFTLFTFCANVATAF